MKRKNIAFVPRTFARVFGAPGDFTESEHLEFLLKADEAWEGAKKNDDYVAHVDSVAKQMEMQTAKFTELEDPKKDNKAVVTWLNSCPITTEAATNDCSITEDELETTSEEYEYELSQKTGFSIDAEKIRTGTYEFDEQVADGLLKADKALSEWWNYQYLLALKSFAGANIAAIMGKTLPFTWDDAETRTNIPAASYNVGMMAKLIKTMILNQVQNGFFIESGDLFEAWWNARNDGANGEGKGDKNRIDALNMTFDMWSFAGAGLEENMFLVDKAAVAVKTYNRYTAKPVIQPAKIGQTWYTMNSRHLPGVQYDVIYEATCKNNGPGKSNILHTWRIQTKGGIWLNPTPCPRDIGEETYQATGVYGFIAVP